MRRLTINFSELKGYIFESINKGHDFIEFITKEGLKKFELEAIDDCCNEVYIEDVCGDLDDLIGHEILSAEESSKTGDGGQGSETWTFYTLRTIKGTVTIRFYGTSNGYYAEEATLYETCL